MKLSLDELANITGIDKVQIGRIERGEQTPGIDKVFRLLAAFDLKLVALPEHTINLVQWLIAQSPKPLDWQQEKVNAKLLIRKSALSLRSRSALKSQSPLRSPSSLGSTTMASPKPSKPLNPANPTVQKTAAPSPPKKIEGTNPYPQVQKTSSEASSSGTPNGAQSGNPNETPETS